MVCLQLTKAGKHFMHGYFDKHIVASSSTSRLLLGNEIGGGLERQACDDIGGKAI